jgi:hypothetical protein
VEKVDLENAVTNLTRDNESILADLITSKVKLVLMNNVEQFHPFVF